MKWALKNGNEGDEYNQSPKMRRFHICIHEKFTMSRLGVGEGHMVQEKGSIERET